MFPEKPERQHHQRDENESTRNQRHYSSRKNFIPSEKRKPFYHNGIYRGPESVRIFEQGELNDTVGIFRGIDVYKSKFDDGVENNEDNN